MVSFLNGRSPFDEAEEKLEAGEVVNGRPKLPSGPIMGWQDGVFLLVVVALIVGGYQYYQHAKGASAEAFSRCDALYLAAAEAPEKFIEAEACYDSTWELAFVSDSMEVLRQERLGAIADMRAAQKDILEDSKENLADGDTLKAVSALKNYAGAMFLNRSDREEWNKIAAIAVAAPAASAVDSLTAKTTAPAEPAAK